MDSGTGETTNFKWDVPEFTAMAVALAHDRFIAQCAGESESNLASITQSNHVIQSWVVSPNGQVAAFVYSCSEAYFGDVLVSGLVYLL